jgi:hypothetical protein
MCCGRVRAWVNELAHSTAWRGIYELPSDVLRVRVYAGMGPISRRRIYLTEVVPAGPKAGQVAERVTRLLNRVDERRSPRTRATVAQLLDKWLEVLDVDPSTRRGYEGYIRKHIRPLLGSLSLTRLDVETLDSFYAELRRCREHCGGRRYVQHRTVRRTVATSTTPRLALLRTRTAATPAVAPASVTPAAVWLVRRFGRSTGSSASEDRQRSPRCNRERDLSQQATPFQLREGSRQGTVSRPARHTAPLRCS